MKLMIYALLGSMLLLSVPFAGKAWSQNQAQNSVAAEDDFFSPKTITVSPGTTVIWTNEGKIPHTATADNREFDSGTLVPGKSYSYTFNTPGTYPYHCKFHGDAGGEGMSGVVNVEAPDRNGS